MTHCPPLGARKKNRRERAPEKERKKAYENLIVTSNQSQRRAMLVPPPLVLDIETARLNNIHYNAFLHEFVIIVSALKWILTKPPLGERAK